MKAGAFFLALVTLALALAACAGIDFGNVVQVRTPAEIQTTTGYPARMSLNESDAAYRAWFEDVQRVGVDWKNSIERGREVSSMLGQLTLGALSEVGPSVAGVPLLSGAAVLVPSLATWFFGRSMGAKAAETTWQSKIDSYNEALKRARAGTEAV